MYIYHDSGAISKRLASSETFEALIGSTYSLECEPLTSITKSCILPRLRLIAEPCPLTLHVDSLRVSKPQINLSPLFPEYESGNLTMAATIVLITGANRGIGKGILELYLKKPNHTVIAANRDPSHPTSKALESLPKAEGTTLHIVKIDALSSTDQAAAVQELAAKGINHIDILIANSGIALAWPKVSEVKVEEIQKHVDVNWYGFVRLYQAFRPVLKEAKEPKWVTIGSGSAFLTVCSPLVFED